MGVRCGESDIGIGSPLQMGCLAVILPKAVSGNRDIAFPSNHAPIQGVLCRETPRPWNMMNIYYNGSLNGFWAEYNVMRPKPMASTGLEPNFGQVGWARGLYYKVGVQGPRPKWVWESHAVQVQTKFGGDWGPRASC